MAAETAYRDYEMTFDCSRVVVGGLTYDRRLLYRVNNILSAEVDMPASVEMIAMERSDQNTAHVGWIGLTCFGIAVKDSPFCMNKESHWLVLGLLRQKNGLGALCQSRPEVSRRLYLEPKGTSLELVEAPSSKR